MSLMRRIKASLRTPYLVTVELHINDQPVHQVELRVRAYNKQRAIKEGLNIVQANVTAKAVGCHREKAQ